MGSAQAQLVQFSQEHLGGPLTLVFCFAVDSLSEHVPAPHNEHATPPQPPVELDPSKEDTMLPHPSADPVRTLVAEGRLLLLVNLEGTLIDVAKPSSVEKWPPEQQHQLQLTVSAQSPSDTSLLQLPGSLLWIKMRPGWQQCMYRLACFYALRLVCCLLLPLAFPDTAATSASLLQPCAFHVRVCRCQHSSHQEL